MHLESIHVLSVKNVFCDFSSQTFKEITIGMPLALSLFPFMWSLQVAIKLQHNIVLRPYINLYSNTPEQIKIINYYVHYQVLRSKSWVHISAIY